MNWILQSCLIYIINWKSLAAYILRSLKSLSTVFGERQGSRHILYVFSRNVGGRVEQGHHVEVHLEFGIGMAHSPVESKTCLLNLFPYLGCKMAHHFPIFTFACLKIIVFDLLVPSLNSSCFFVSLIPIERCPVQILPVLCIRMFKFVSCIEVLCIFLGKGGEKR